MKLRFLPQEALKTIACITMLIDHIGYLFFPQALWMRMVGRIAFPLYCFLLTQGMRHTRSRPKYLLRLALIAVVSEFTFDYAFYGGFTWKKQSVMVTLLLGAIMCALMQLVKKLCKKPLAAVSARSRFLGQLLTAFFMGLVFFPFHYSAHFFQSDYGWKGIFLISVFMIAWELPLKELWCLAGLLYLSKVHGGSMVQFWGQTFPFQLPALLALVPVFFYSGKKLTRNPVLTWSFNLFYPVHLAILALI